MKICYTKTHGEICHDESDCPVCAIIEEKDTEYQDLEADTSNEIQKLKDKVDELESVIAETQAMKSAQVDTPKEIK